MSHVALLGDSVFDNATYVRGEPDVTTHLREALGGGWQVTLLAVDGTTTTNIGAQLDRVRKQVTHLVLSVGGNDALAHADLLEAPVRSTGHALDLFGACLDEFESSYRDVLAALAELGRTLTICTIYAGDLPAPRASRARVALMMFNDVIVRAAAEVDADVIDMRSVCNRAEDFSSSIEPSVRGGRRIARAVAAAIDGSAGGSSRLLRPRGDP
jgi:hypothetical protein